MLTAVHSSLTAKQIHNGVINTAYLINGAVRSSLRIVNELLVLYVSVLPCEAMNFLGAW